MIWSDELLVEWYFWLIDYFLVFSNMKKLDLVKLIHEVGFKSNDLQETIENEVISRCKMEKGVNWSRKVQKFLYTVQSKYVKHHIVYERFLKGESEWLSHDIFENSLQDVPPRESDNLGQDAPPRESDNLGRPRKIGFICLIG